MALSRAALLALKTEIQSDPRSVGYAGKSDAQIAALLNDPHVRQVTITVSAPPPINRILSGLAGQPNLVESADVTTAKVTV